MKNKLSCISNNKIALVEDHHEALEVWRKKDLRNLDLVHIDAHIDFDFQIAKPIKKLVLEARDMRGLKKDLETTLAFMSYEKNLDKQTNIGNYIYPAICEGIVKDFYWVVPGGLKEFKESYKFIKNKFKRFSSQEFSQAGHKSSFGFALDSQDRSYNFKKGIISTQLLGRRFVVCILDKLPMLRSRALLDIDTDFLLVNNLKNADNTSMIGRRRPCIWPKDLVDILKDKIKNPQVITISYSVNGGYTPIRYKHLGDELAYRFDSNGFKKHYRQRIKAAEFFNLFESTGKKAYYKKAIRINPSYRVADNNYGPLYLSLGKLSKAEREFKRMARVDCKNPYPLMGLGNIYLRRRGFVKSKKFFSKALKLKKNLPGAILGIAKTEFFLKRYSQAKKFFSSYQKKKPMDSQGYYFLGCIYQKEKKFKDAVIQYQHSLRLGLNNFEILFKLLKISLNIKTNSNIINFISVKFSMLKKEFIRVKKANLKNDKKIKDFSRIDKKLAVLENRLNQIKNSYRFKGFGCIQKANKKSKN